MSIGDRKNAPSLQARKLAAARGLLKVAHPPAGQFHHARLAAPTSIAGLVEHIWIVRWWIEEGTSHVAQTLPYPNLHLVIENSQAWVHGIHRGRFTRELNGVGGVIGVKFRPGGFYPLLKKSVSTLRNRAVALEAILGASAHDLSRELSTPDLLDADAVALAERFLVRHLPAHDQTVDRVAHMVAEIESDRTILTVEDAVARFSLTKRSLQRVFEQYVGIGPKWVINRFRMHEAIERLNQGEPVDWAAFALELGYFDQAHFNRDFKSLIGCTPRRYVAGA
jgi:AraC-like DNA-binding protein